MPSACWAREPVCTKNTSTRKIALCVLFLIFLREARQPCALPLSRHAMVHISIPGVRAVEPFSLSSLHVVTTDLRSSPLDRSPLRLTPGFACDVVCWRGGVLKPAGKGAAEGDGGGDAAHSPSWHVGDEHGGDAPHERGEVRAPAPSCRAKRGSACRQLHMIFHYVWQQISPKSPWKCFTPYDCRRRLQKATLIGEGLQHRCPLLSGVLPSASSWSAGGRHGGCGVRTQRRAAVDCFRFEHFKTGPWGRTGYHTFTSHFR